MNSQPLAIDLFCGLGGWSDGLIAEGWRVIGYDIEAHQYGDQKYPGELVIRDVLTIHGSEFKDADLIVASPPCQEYSYMAMPWSRAKTIEKEYLEGKRDRKKLTALFDACFRIQREASEAAGRYIPMVVENVRGAQKWVGKARWNFGSYYLFGDVPALMPITQKARKGRSNFHQENGLPSPSFHGAEHEPSVQRNIHFKSQGMNWLDQTKKGQDFTRLAGEHCGHKTEGHANKRNGHGHTRHLTNQAESDLCKKETNLLGFHVQKTVENSGATSTNNTPSSVRAHQSTNGNQTLIQPGIKQPGISGQRTNGKGDRWFEDGAASSGSKSNARKAASAMIAKIPFPLAQWIAKTMKPSAQPREHGSL